MLDISIKICYYSRMNKHKRGAPPTCHPDNPHFGNGLCKACYQREYDKTGKRKEWYLKNREEQLAKNRLRYQLNKEARLAQCREYRLLNKDKCKNNELLHRYGISLDDFNNMRKAQNNLCKFCNETLPSRAVVDHCHITGKVRGLLHQKCNIIIGFFETNKHLFKNLEPYLRNNG